MEQKTNETASTRRLALKWWSDESNLLNRTTLFDRYFSNTATKDKMFTVANNYEELTGREIEEIWKKETASKWFASKTYIEQHGLSDKYFESRNPSLLTIEQVEEIYDKEVLEPKRQKEWQESQVNCRYTKPNAKEFKQFDESLFKAYTDKLPHNEVGTMIGILSRRLNKLELTGVIEDLKVALNYK